MRGGRLSSSPRTSIRRRPDGAPSAVQRVSAAASRVAEHDHRVTPRTSRLRAIVSAGLDPAPTKGETGAPLERCEGQHDPRLRAVRAADCHDVVGADPGHSPLVRSHTRRSANPTSLGRSVEPDEVTSTCGSTRCLRSRWSAPALAVARAQVHCASRDDGVRVQVCDGGIRSTLTQRDEVSAGEQHAVDGGEVVRAAVELHGCNGGSVITPAQPPPDLVRVVTQLVEREPAGGARRRDARAETAGASCEQSFQDSPGRLCPRLDPHGTRVRRRDRGTAGTPP